MKLIRQIVLALGLLAAFICLTVFSSAEYPASNSNLKATNDKSPLINEAFSSLNMILSYTDKIPLLKEMATTTMATTTAKETSNKIDNILNKTDVKDAKGELINSAAADSLKSMNFSDLWDRLKKVLNKDWSRF